MWDTPCSDFAKLKLLLELTWAKWHYHSYSFIMESMSKAELRCLEMRKKKTVNKPTQTPNSVH